MRNTIDACKAAGPADFDNVYMYGKEGEYDGVHAIQSQ
jgi:hypothetical protein